LGVGVLINTSTMPHFFESFPAFKFTGQNTFFGFPVEISDDGMGYDIQGQALCLGDWVIMEEGKLKIVPDKDFKHDFILDHGNLYDRI